MTTKTLSYSPKSDRQELDVKIWLVLVIGLAVTLGIYAVILPIKHSFLGILLYERGFTQVLAILFGGMVMTITILKLFKIQRELQAFKKDLIPATISLDNPNSIQVEKLQQSLTNEKSLLARRYSRVVAAYIVSGNRQAATEFAMEDSAFYSSTAETSYSVARILVWAIPLLGFIGTVFGISGAVNGFSGFLQQSSDIEQIKQGIGTVTSGLAVAFDTTLLALFVSVLVMIPLVLAERQESRLLLAIDVYINDKLLPRLKEGEGLNKAIVNDAIGQAFQKHLPSPEVLIQPAQEYARQAAEALAKGFVNEVGKIQVTTNKLIQQMNAINQMAVKDRENFIATLTQQQQSSHEIVKEIQHISIAVLDNYQSINQDFNTHTEHITEQLQKAATTLDSRIAALENCAHEVARIVEFQRSLEQSLQSLEKTAQLERVLGEVRSNLALLRPVLEQLNKPRRITLVEADENCS
ncbi:MotA/TolQ/ExbB proton channel family protein [Tolypothrix sp. FACHB-123]|uniref:MotA/TolQ/ExbB proton channel family protein n=1 Tax=Tolypothrix sp. FACHB-123 TaxID=2692868 RepID=UPI0016832624|nr:MotA/TolQ/ExbB proton channel family protein [Tolypothrix sp. FACHB-123]MBD2359393.1 MotA/TolQ/ExbB proton channel family protein [Tolypothrix sp. FACHB-123]